MIGRILLVLCLVWRWVLVLVLVGLRGWVLCCLRWCVGTVVTMVTAVVWRVHGDENNGK
jgi:hypothetical protein